MPGIRRNNCDGDCVSASDTVTGMLDFESLVPGGSLSPILLVTVIMMIVIIDYYYDDESLMMMICRGPGRRVAPPGAVGVAIMPRVADSDCQCHSEPAAFKLPVDSKSGGAGAGVRRQSLRCRGRARLT